MLKLLKVATSCNTLLETEIVTCTGTGKHDVLFWEKPNGYLAPWHCHFKRRAMVVASLGKNGCNILKNRNHEQKSIGGVHLHTIIGGWLLDNAQHQGGHHRRLLRKDNSSLCTSIDNMVELAVGKGKV